ncbi:MAG: hypothetical protein R6X16_01900, partial [Anaerolineae bacterium]
MQIRVRTSMDDLQADERVVRARAPRSRGHGTQEVANALIVKSNAGTQEIGARLTLLLTPRLNLAPPALEFEQDIEAAFYLENEGYGTLRVHITSDRSWITVNRQEWTIKARNRARVRVRLLDAPENGQGNIEIHTPDAITLLPIQIKD